MGSAGAWHAGLVEAAHVLIGEGFWVRPPARDYLALLESSEEEFRDHRGNVQAGIDAGLVPLHAAVSSADEWDEYEWKYSRAIERYAQERPDDPEVPEILARIRRWRDGYLRWGRDTLGLPRICSSVLSRTAQGWAKAGSARDCWACQWGMSGT